MGLLKLGIHCKACDKPLPTKNIDPELCMECFGVVMDMNKDLIDELTPEELWREVMKKT
jgi:hypothetical protein